MCEYCDNEKLNYGCQKDIVVKELDGGIFGKFHLHAMILPYTENIRLCVSLDGSKVGDPVDYISVRINYCPICGRKLREEEEDGEGEKMNEWISAKEMIPEDDDIVVISSRGTLWLAWRQSGDGDPFKPYPHWDTNECSFDDDEVDYWMRIPNPPGERREYE